MKRTTLDHYKENLRRLDKETLKADASFHPREQFRRAAESELRRRAKESNDANQH